MLILRQKQYGFGSKVLAVLNPNAWAGKELAKFQSGSKEEYKRNRWKTMLKSVFAPITTRNMLKRAQEMHAQGYDPSTIKENTNIGIGRTIAGGVLGTVTGGTSTRVGSVMNTVRGLRTKLNEDNPGWRKKFD